MATTASTVILDALANAGVRRIFGIPGDAINGLVDAARRNESIDFITVRHEEAGAFAASAAAKLSGNLGAVAGTAGPGAIHLLNGLYDAKLDGAPIVALTGQVKTSLLGQESHQELDLLRLFDDVSCFNEVLVDPDQAADLIEAAIRSAVTERGVAHLNIPSDVALIDTGTTAHRVDSPPAIGQMIPDEEQLSLALDLLGGATSPSILVGIGAREAMTGVLELADAIGAPIIKSLRAKDLIPDSHPNVIGGLGLLGTEPSVDAIGRTDVLVMVGTDFPYEDFYPDNASVIQIDIDPRRIGRRTGVSAQLVGDATDTLRELNTRLVATPDKKHLAEARNQMRSWDQLQAKAESDDSVPIRPQRLAAEISNLTPPGTIFVCDTGAVTVWGARHLKMKPGDRFTLSSSLASMAFALPGAIGAQLAYPDRKVVALAGDGGFGMLMGDLMTAVSLDLPFTVVIFNNSKLGLIKMEQEAAGLPEFGTDLANPDFARVARAMGADGLRVEAPDEIAPALGKAISSSRPFVIDAVIDPNEMTIPPKIQAGFALNFAKAKAKELLQPGGSVKDTLGSVKDAAKRAFEKA